MKQYELSNHLGNVLVVFADKKVSHEGSAGVVGNYTSSLLNVQDYFPFGWSMPGRKYSNSNKYRQGFQRQEGDDEIGGEDAFVSFKYRFSDNRNGRFWSVDPLSSQYPHNSTYAFSENSTIAYIELEGLEKYFAADGTYIGQLGSNTDLRLLNKDGVRNQTVQQLKELLCLANDENYEFSGMLTDIFKFESTPILIDVPDNLFNDIWGKSNPEAESKPYGDMSSKKKEQSGYLLLNVNSATITFSPHSDQMNTRSQSVASEFLTEDSKNTYMSGFKDIIILGMLHTHPNKEEEGYESKPHKGDMKVALKIKAPSYTLGHGGYIDKMALRFGSSDDYSNTSTMSVKEFVIDVLETKGKLNDQ